MKKISGEEQQAIRDVLAHGRRYGYGNLISHLKTAWARCLLADGFLHKTSEAIAAGGPGYDFEMQDDILERGEWDETGERYRAKKRRRGKSK